MPSDAPAAVPTPAAPGPAAETPSNPSAGQPATAPAALQRLRALSVASAAALALLCLAWELWLAPTGQRTLAIKALPLLLALPGMLRHRLYTYRWVSLALWLYVLEGLLRATTESGVSQGLAVGEVGLSLLLFAAATLYIRRRLRASRPASST